MERLLKIGEEGCFSVEYVIVFVLYGYELIVEYFNSQLILSVI